MKKQLLITALLLMPIAWLHAQENKHAQAMYTAFVETIYGKFPKNIEAKLKSMNEDSLIVEPLDRCISTVIVFLSIMCPMTRHCRYAPSLMLLTSRLPLPTAITATRQATSKLSSLVLRLLGVNTEKHSPYNSSRQ